MITKIGFELPNKNNFYNKQYKNQNKQPNTQTFTQMPQNLQSAYYLPFLGNETKTSKSKMTKLENITYYSDQSAKKFLNELREDAGEFGYDSINVNIIMRRNLIEATKYIEDLNGNKKDYKKSDLPPIADMLDDDLCIGLFADKEKRTAILPILKKNIEIIENELINDKPVQINTNKSIDFDEFMTDTLWAGRDEDSQVNKFQICEAAFAPTEGKSYEQSKKMWEELSETIMQNKTPANERTPFSFYEVNAKNIIKNLQLGTNMFVIYDGEKDVPNNLLDTVHKIINENGNEKIRYIELNKLTRPEYFEDLIIKLKKDKAHDYIVALNPSSLIDFSDNLDEENVIINGNSYPKSFKNAIDNQPTNIKFLFYDTKDELYSNSDIYSNFDEISIPTLNSQQMYKYFQENPQILEKLKINISEDALKEIVFASSKINGTFPEKTIALLKKLNNFAGDKNIIEKDDVKIYLKQIAYMFKKNNDDNSFDIIFDTGKTLKDLTGKTSTKKEAEMIVKQIKSGKLGTKGFIVYSQDGSIGSGKRFTAKAIAGEANVPYIEVNAVDFGTKDVYIFGSNALSPEASVKKLFSTVVEQAKANPNNSAVLFIENFEYFSVGELVSEYHEKAMAQLLREMDKAQEQGLNILVMGAVSDENLLGEAAMKSFKFVDKLEISSPAYNKLERKEIIAKTIKNLKLDINGNKSDLINYIADITNGFPFISLKSLIKKAQSVALERGHESLEKSDFTEAYLQLTTGRPAVIDIRPHEKRIITAHECGHATNLEVMNNAAKTLGKTWHIPNKVNFITLDPRGIFGGAVYHGKDINSEQTFENIFASLVMTFGGYSCEKNFFGIDGSYGITSDMKTARNYSEIMVKIMGMGTKTGKMSIDPNEDLSDNMKRIIEDDERVILNNAKITSDLITEIYEDFNKQFTQKYSPLVGTGECILDGDKFRKALNEWKAAQSPEKQKELAECDKVIIEIMEATKRGIAVQKNNR